MKSTITKPEFSQPAGDTAVYLFDDWFDPIEVQVRERVRGCLARTARPRNGRARCCGPISAARSLLMH